MSQTVNGYQPRFDAPCQVCNRKAPGDYIRYSFLGLELLYLVCLDCYTYLNIAGLSRLSAEIDSIREQLRKRGADDNKADDRDVSKGE